MKPIKLDTDQNTYDELYKLVDPDDKKGKPTKNVSVERKIILHLLMDHAKLVARLEEYGEKV